MAKKLTSVTYHTTSLPRAQKGVVRLGNAVTEANFKDYPDPLSRAGGQANKPGSSIPTIFARMLFFRTAFKETVLSDNITDLTTVYNQIVSQCFDLLELVFNNDSSLSYIKWNPEDQLDRLMRIEGHEELTEALKVHFDKFLKPYGVTEITLIIDTDMRQVAGGTSPFTFVYTSPNWKSGKPATLLNDRDPKFKEYIYRLYAAIENTVTDKTAVQGFMEYVKKCADLEPRNIRDIAFDKTYSITNLNADYPAVELNGIRVLIASFDNNAQDIFLAARPQGAIQSDFFIDSNLHEFNQVSTPLILVKGQYHALNYHDGIHWNDGTTVPQEELDIPVARQLPGAPGVNHLWYTTIDFLQDSLIKLPYQIDATRFIDAINTKDSSYLLPIKPKLLEYFTVEEIKQMLAFGFGNEQHGEPTKLTVSLRIPVRDNSDSRHNHVVLEKEYDLTADVIDTISSPVAVGMSPFVRIPENDPRNKNRFTVVLQHQNIDGFDDSLLKFYRAGSEKPIDEEDLNPKTRGSSPRATYYTVKGNFDAIQFCLKKEKGDLVSACAGMILPDFKDISNNGSQKYFYGVDFGTTNTHIAFAKEGGEPTSFGHEELRQQVAYLADMPKAVRDAENFDRQVQQMEYVFGFQGTDIKQSLERQFFPYGVANQFEFPIRTVTGEENPLDRAESQVFSGASIGFRYPKELVDVANFTYKTDVKWQFENTMTDEGSIRASMFFREILEIIRTHWLNMPDARYSEPPYIIFTFPLAMGNRTQVTKKWREEYVKVFNVTPQEATAHTLTMFESLAPAYNLIYRGIPPTEGILNVDIGGGTTDIQYYRKSGNNQYAFYNSVRFAGDDLWGTGYENIPNAPGQGVKDSVFTDFAAEKLKDVNLYVDIIPKKFQDIQKTGKELINVLLRDREESFMNALKRPSMDTARKVLFIHYAALIYHIVNLVKAAPEATGGMFPKELNFTGFGSKYIEALFGDDYDNETLTKYTKALIENFGVAENAIREDFKLNFDKNPKNATAEGAVLFGRDKLLEDKKAVKPDTVIHFGYESEAGEIPRYDQLEGNIDKNVYKFFSEFLDKMQKAGEDFDKNVPTLTPDEKSKLISRASTSFKVVMSSTVDPNDRQKRVSDSMFFWNLKGSLYNLHK